MKYLLLFPLLVAFCMVGHISTASAHCGTCEASMEKTKKICNSKKAKKDCGCDKKGHHHHAHNKKEKPCKVCMESEKKYQMKKKRSEIFFND